MAKTARESLLLILDNHKAPSFSPALVEFRRYWYRLSHLFGIDEFFFRSIDAIQTKSEELGEKSLFKKILLHANDKKALAECQSSFQKSVEKFQVCALDIFVT
jgi:hypothetical protein